MTKQEADMDGRRAPMLGESTSGRMSVKASSALANDLRTRILTGEFVEGNRLPSERELCVQSGLSRTSVREALRTIEMEGLISIRPGRGGGSEVRKPASESVEKSIDQYIRGHNVKLASIVEIREILEPVVAHLAAERRNDQDLVDIAQAHARVEACLDQPQAFLRANVAWHLAVVQASHNELLVSFMTAIARAVFAGTADKEFDSDDVRKTTVTVHSGILRAIIERDGDAAERRMRRHVHAYAELATLVDGEKGGSQRKLGAQRSKKKVLKAEA